MKDLSNTESVSYKRSLLIGMLLGDASARRRDRKEGQRRVQFTVTHGTVQHDLVVWKANEIQRLLGVTVCVHEYEYQGKGRATFSFTLGKRVRVVHDWFHRNHRKTITDKIRFMDHPIGLAMLLCDDGSIRKRKKQHKDGSIYYLQPSITLATHCFSGDEVELLLNHLKSLYGVDGYINPERRVRQGKLKEYQRVNFNSLNSKKLWDCVSPWIPQIESMLAKFSFAFERYGR
jgi:hypothetical protein